MRGSLQIEGAVYELACQLASVTNKTTSKGFPQNVGTNKSNQSAAAVGGSGSVTRGRGRVKTVQTSRLDRSPARHQLGHDGCTVQRTKKTGGKKGGGTGRFRLYKVSAKDS